MNKRIGWICRLAAGIGIVAGAGLTASAAKPVAIEKELLGIRVLQNYREVLLRYGAPSRIFRATETVNYEEALSLAGGGTGGIVGIADSSSGGGGMGGSGGGGMMGPPPGMMGGSGMMGGGGKGSGRMGPPPGMMGGSSSGGMMGGASGGGMMGGSGGGGQAGDNPDGSYSEAGGFTWVYLYPGKRLAYEFHFNKDGRIERIAELGNAWGQHTSRGIGLGDTLEKVYSVYGWTDRIKDEGTAKFSLLYNDRYHAQFLVLKNKVIGISVFLKENQFMRFDGGAGGSGMMAGSSGGPVGGMMSGGPGGGMRMPGAGPSMSGAPGGYGGMMQRGGKGKMSGMGQ